MVQYLGARVAGDRELAEYLSPATRALKYVANSSPRAYAPGLYAIAHIRGLLWQGCILRFSKLTGDQYAMTHT
jgi:hypothetical protein